MSYIKDEKQFFMKGLRVDSGFESTGAATVGGALTVAGATTLASLAVTGATTTTSGINTTTGIAGCYIPQVFFGNVTTAEVNAGKVLLAALTGRTYRIVDFKVTARGGAAGGATSVDLKDTNSSPVVIAAIPVGCLTQDESIGPDFDDGTNTVAGGAGGGGAALTASKGVQIIKNGSDVTTATSFDVLITFIATGA